MDSTMNGFTRNLLWMLLLGAVAPVGISSTQAAPEPALAPRAWELDFEFSDPQRITVRVPGEAEARIFWYVIYRVTNETRREIHFYPTFEIVTSKYRVYPSDLATHPKVYNTIKKRHAKTHPFLVEPVDALGRLLQGEDNTRASVAIWSAFDADEDVDKFMLYIGGLSGEVTKVRNPHFDPSSQVTKKNPRFFVLRKTLAVEYSLPGNRKTQRKVRPVRVERTWVMR